jgi:hypothetical protein
LGVLIWFGVGYFSSDLLHLQLHLVSAMHGGGSQM